MSMFSIAVSGMSAQSSKLEVISNNIANSATLAFKSQWVQFSEDFVSEGSQAANGNIIQGGEGVSVASINSDWSTGSAQITNEMTNIMISGDGFVAVAYNDEVYYTRAGDFSLVEYPTDSGTYVFMRPNGAILLGYSSGSFGEAPDATNYLSFNSTTGTAPTSIEIAADGTVTAEDGITVNNGYIGVQCFNNENSLSKSQGGLYQPTYATSYTTDYPVEPGTSGAGSLTQGALEGSNTDLVTEFTEMIQAQRAFQANSKSVTTADEILQTLMNM